MKKGVNLLIFVILASIIILSISFASANWFSDLFKSKEIQLSPVSGCMTISQPGIYELTSNIIVPANKLYCIIIRSDNVILDGKGYTIDGNLRGNIDYDTGINVLSSQTLGNNVTIKNIVIVNYTKGIGIDIRNVNNVTLYNNRLTNNKWGVVSRGFSSNKVNMTNNFACNNILADFSCSEDSSLVVNSIGTGNIFTNVETCANNWPVINTHYTQCTSSTGGGSGGGGGTIAADGLPVGFTPITAYWHRNPRAISTNLGVVTLWDANGNGYYTQNGINFARWNETGTNSKANANLPVGYKPILSYYQGFPGNETIILVDANRVVYAWNYTSGKYMLKSGFGDGLPANFLPTTAYWQDTGKNGGTVSLISPTAWYVARSDEVFSKLTSSVPGLPFDPVQGRFTPKVAYYSNYTSGAFGTFDPNNPSQIITTQDVREVYAWIYNTTSGYAELYKYPYPGHVITDTFSLTSGSEKTSNGYTFNLTSLDKSANPIKATIKIIAPNGDREVKTFSLSSPNPLLETLTFASLGLNVRIWMVFTTNDYVMLTYSKGNLVNTFHKIGYTGLPIDKVPDVGYYDRIRKKFVLWYGADSYESDNGYQFTKVRGETPVTTPTCVDTDGGNHYYTQGSTGSSILGNSNVDSCVASDTSGKRLTEYYCENNEVKSTGYNCPNRCSNGKCVFIEANQSTCNKNACGDVDSNGAVTNVDKEIIEGILQSPEWWTADPYRYNVCYDLDNDGRISVLDTRIVERAISGDNVCSYGSLNEGTCREFCAGEGGQECPNAEQTMCDDGVCRVDCNQGCPTDRPNRCSDGGCHTSCLGEQVTCDNIDDCPRGQFCNATRICASGECLATSDCVGNKVCVNNFCESPGQVRQRCRALISGGLELPVRTRVTDNNIVKYCDVDLAYKLAGATNSTCNNDYECISNACIEGKCIPIASEIREQGNLLRNIWKTLSCFIQHPIDVTARNQCINS